MHCKFWQQTEGIMQDHKDEKQIEEAIKNNDFYKLLGVDVKATKNEITKAYRKLATIYHPDKDSYYEAVSKKTRQDMMALLNQAYATLADDEKRLAYDRDLLNKKQKVEQPQHVKDLISAIMQNDAVKLQSLLKSAAKTHKFNLNKPIDEFGTTLLHVAAMHGKITAVETLIANNAKVDAKDIDGNTPLHRAAAGRHGDHIDTVIELLNNDADVNAQNNLGETPIHIASKKASIDMIETLLEEDNIDLTIVNKNGETPPQLASTDEAEQTFAEYMTNKNSNVINHVEEFANKVFNFFSDSKKSEPTKPTVTKPEIDMTAVQQHVDTIKRQKETCLKDIEKYGKSLQETGRHFYKDKSNDDARIQHELAREKRVYSIKILKALSTVIKTGDAYLNNPQSKTNKAAYLEATKQLKEIEAAFKQHLEAVSKIDVTQKKEEPVSQRRMR